jgi:DNA invertase Pin-like site-specific DNA recombinase
MDACAYLRKSQNEADDPHILDRHRALLLRLALQDGRELGPADLYEEIGSGELIETRPAFRRLLRAWEALPRDHGGMVYVVELARLTRGLLSDQGRVMDVLMRVHLLIRTPSRVYDLRVWDDRFAFMAHGLVANAELELAKERFARAKREMLLAGLPRSGMVPWGYRWDKGTRTVQASGDFPLLVRCCREVQHESIARLSLRYGVPATTLHQTLTNPFICGWPVQHSRVTEARRAAGPKAGQRLTERLPRHLWVWPEQENTSYPHACTRAEWEAVWQVLQQRRTRGEKTKSENGWCRDVVRFEGVARLPRLGRYAGRGGVLATYAVQSPGGPLLYIGRELIHAAALNALRTALRDPDGLRAALWHWERVQAQNAVESPPAASAAELQGQRDRAQRQAVELLQRELDASPAAQATIALLRERKEAEVERLTAELQALAGRTEVPFAAGPWLAHLAELADGFDAVWAAATEAERREIVTGFIAAIPVRVEPGARACWRKRTVLPVVYRDWLPPL